ncbi:MAG: beta-propeller domain-containing protein [Myxococcota bacterium]
MRPLYTALWMLGLLAACDGRSTISNPNTNPDRLDWSRAAALTAASDCDEAAAAFKAAAVTQMQLELDRTERCFLGNSGCYRWLEDGDVATPGTATNDDKNPDDYSQTNTQVEGVDEADIVKTDGTSIVGLFGQELVKLSSWPAAETHETGRASVKGYPTAFFMADGKAVVLSSASYYDFLSPEDRAAADRGDLTRDVRWWSGLTLVTTFDVSGDVPVLLAQRLFDGYTIANRRIDDKVYLAQSTWVYVDGLEYWPQNVTSDSSEADIRAEFERMRTKNTALIEALPLDYWLPRELELGADGTIASTAGKSLVACTDVYAPSVHAGQGLMTLVTYDLDDDTLAGSTIQGSWGNVYASTDAIYFASTNWDYYWWWETEEAVPPLETQIHKFVIGDDGVARYTASGKVLGYAIDQFAFDEHDGILRVATTDGFGWWNPSQTETESRVTTLAQNGKNLVERGVVAGLGKGENIYGVRFVGDRGYVVTFKQVDPLYVLDLADPTAPKVAGQLKVPGFSSYIHPIDDQHLLTIGREADDTGHVGGLKLEVFDVSDPAHPRSTVSTLLGDGWNTWSEAQYDHHAFVYYPARQLLAIPVSGWLDEGDGYWSYKSQLFVFKVTADSVQELGGDITHDGLLESLGVDMSCRSWYGWYSAWIRRGVFIEDYVYSVSDIGVVVHDTRDFGKGPVAQVLTANPQSWWGGGMYIDACPERGDGVATEK